LLVVLAPGDFVSLISLSILSVFLACPCLYEVLLILLSLLCLARSKESLSLLYFWEYASKLPEELLPVTSQPVIGLLASFWGNDCWASYSADNLLGERVALQVHAGRVVPYVEPPSDKNSGRVTAKRIYERVARQVVAGRVAPYAKLQSFKALGELLEESLLVEFLERVAG
jgi:hypothetical protein